MIGLHLTECFVLFFFFKSNTRCTISVKKYNVSFSTNTIRNSVINANDATSFVLRRDLSQHDATPILISLKLFVYRSIVFDIPSHFDTVIFDQRSALRKKWLMLIELSFLILRATFHERYTASPILNVQNSIIVLSFA